MKYLIVYTSKTGTNKKCAEILKGFSKIIANIVVKTSKKNTKINEENINKFLEKIK